MKNKVTYSSNYWFKLIFFYLINACLLNGQVIKGGGITEGKNVGVINKETTTKSASTPLGKAQDERNAPYATAEFISDIEGTLYLQDKKYELQRGNKKSITVPKEYKYLFITQDSFVIDGQKSLATSDKGKKIVQQLDLADKYEQWIHRSAYEKNLQTILSTIRDNMVYVPYGFEHAGKLGEEQIEGFEIGRYEVTYREYKTFYEDKYKTSAPPGVNESSYIISTRSLHPRITMTGIDWRHDATGEYMHPQGYNNPVVNVSWKEANEYCKWLSDQDPYYLYRLPTEREWMHAAGCGLNLLYGETDELPSDYDWANTKDIAYYGVMNKEPRPPDLKYNDGVPFTAPVGRFEPNCLGIYDLFGNAAEWVQDEYNDGRETDGGKHTIRRIVKGGSFFGLPEKCNIRTVDRWDENKRSATIGFRVVRERKVGR